MFYSSNGNLVNENKNKNVENFMNVPFLQFVSAKNAGLKSSKNIESDADIIAQGKLKSTKNIEADKDILAKGKVKSYLLESNKIDTSEAIFDELEVNNSINVNGMLKSESSKFNEIETDKINITGMLKSESSKFNDIETEKINVSGSINLLKDLNINSNINITGDIRTVGGNNWIYHTPDDKRHILYIAPSKKYGQVEWDFAKSLQIRNTGLVVCSELHTHKNVSLGGGSVRSHFTIGKNLGIRGHCTVNKNCVINNYLTVKKNIHVHGHHVTNRSIQGKEHLHISKNINVRGDIVFNGGNNWIIHTPDDKRRTLYIAPSGTYGRGNWNWRAQVRIESNGKALASGGFHSLSDSRVKKDIKKLNNCLKKINTLNGYSFTREDFENDDRQLGLIAQEVEKVFPESVDTDEKNDLKSLSYDSLIAPLVESIKELTKLNSNLTKRIEELESKV